MRGHQGCRRAVPGAIPHACTAGGPPPAKQACPPCHACSAPPLPAALPTPLRTASARHASHTSLLLAMAHPARWGRGLAVGPWAWRMPVQVVWQSGHNDHGRTNLTQRLSCTQVEGPPMPGWAQRIPSETGIRIQAFRYNRQLVAEANTSHTVFDVVHMGAPVNCW